MSASILTPEQIAEYIHEEHTPYASMSLEEGKKHLAGLIQRYADWYKNQPEVFDGMAIEVKK